jgi:trigger factor
MPFAGTRRTSTLTVQVTVEKLGPCQARVSFTVPSDEFQGALRKALGEAGKNVRMKGFRPGHVPTELRTPARKDPPGRSRLHPQGLPEGGR